MATETEDIFVGSQFISSITDLMKAQGMTLETGSDFRTWREALKDQPKRGPLAPKFDPDINVLDETSAFWIMGRDSSGEIVHTQAARTIDLGGETLASYLQKRFSEFTPAGFKIDEDQSIYRSAPGARHIAGKVCYHGELWLKGGPGGYRGTGTTAVLARLTMAMCLLKWSPHYIFGFLFPLAACKGLAAREGYMHTEPDAIHWALPGKSEKIEEWAVWMGREDIRHILHIPPAALFEQLESQRADRRRERAA